MKIQNTNCSWKPNILQGPSLLLHTNFNPWKGGRGVAWDQLFPQINRLPFSLGILYLPLSTVDALEKYREIILKSERFFPLGLAKF